MAIKNKKQREEKTKLRKNPLLVKNKILRKNTGVIIL